MQQKVFLAIALLFGLLFIFITPPFQAADEFDHFYRSYDLSQGSLFPPFADMKNNLTGSMMPSSLLKISADFKSIPFHPEKKAKLEKVAAAAKIPLNEAEKRAIYYRVFAASFPGFNIPQIAGILLGRSAGCPPIFYLYIGRMLNLAVWMLLVFCAIRTTPVFKWVFLLLALAPMSLFQAASLSADAGLNAVALLFIALLLRMAFDEDYRLKRRRMIGLFLMGALITISKGGAYFPLLFLFFIIPSGKFSGKIEKHSLFSLLVFNCLMGLIIWKRLTEQYAFSAMYPGLSISDFSARLNYLLNYPVDCLNYLMRSIYMGKFILIRQFVGGLGWLDTRLPDAAIAVYLMVMVSASLLDQDDRVSIPVSDKTLFLSVFCLTSMTIFAGIWLTFAPAANDLFIPAQGRYWIPVAPLFFLLFFSNMFGWIRNRERLIALAAPVSCVLMLTLSCFVLINRYWI